MTQELPERDLLRTIDPAPHPLTAQQQERHLRRVQTRLRAPRPSRPARAILLPALAGAVAAALAAVLLLPAHVRTDPGPVASSTAGRATALTAGSITRSGVRVLTTARVGDAVFLLGSRDDDIRLAATFDGSDPDRSWERVTPRPSMGGADVLLFSAANFPDAVPGGVAQAAGYAGADVVSLDIRTHDGTRHVTVADGYWLAAWHGAEFSDAPDVAPTGITVHLRDGTSTTETWGGLTER